MPAFLSSCLHCPDVVWLMLWRVLTLIEVMEVDEVAASLVTGHIK
jgi:hypothetical protein